MILNKIFTFSLVFLTCFPLKMLANEVNKESSSELSVEADISLEWFEKEKYYLAKGNVLLKKDGLILKANIVRADYAVENGENVLKKITAKEKVLLTKDKSEANGQFMTYDVAKKIAILSEIGRAHVRTPVTSLSRMPSSA